MFCHKTTSKVRSVVTYLTHDDFPYAYFAVVLCESADISLLCYTFVLTILTILNTATITNVEMAFIKKYILSLSSLCVKYSV